MAINALASAQTPEELVTGIGQQLRDLRLMRNVDQVTLAARAGVSVGALKNLESGEGANLTTFVKVLRALDRAQWLAGLAPVATINPLTLVKRGAPRQRARLSTSAKVIARKVKP